MANLTGPGQAFHADTSIVDTEAKATVGTLAMDPSGNEYVYLRGTASVAAGNWVSFNQSFQTELLAANAVGPVAIAMAAVTADRYGWFQVYGVNTIAKTDTIAANKSLYIDGTSGRVDDLVVTGDLVIGAYSMTASSDNVATVSLNHPHVSDDIGGGSGGAHTHVLADILDAGNSAGLNVGTAAGTVAAGDHNHTGVYEPANTLLVKGTTSTDNAVARFDGTSGALIQNSAVTIADTSGDITGGKYNKITITAPASGATLTLADGSSLITSGGNAITLTSGTTTNVTLPSTGTLATLAGSESLSNKTLVNPVLGSATATTVNKIVITAPASGGTLTIADGSTLATSGAYSQTLTATGATNVTLPTTGTLATLAGTEELDNKTLDSSVGKGTWTASGTWTLPAVTAGEMVTFAENVSIHMPADTLSADGKYCGITVTGTAGAALAFGDIVYFTASSTWDLADADSEATSGNVRLGMAVQAAGGNGSATKVLTYGAIRADAVFPSFTVGTTIYVSTTAGDVVSTAPSGTDDVIRVVGHAITADSMFFNPSNSWITHT